MRELLQQAIQHHDHMQAELDNTKRQLSQYQKENETLLSEVAQAATKIQELEASQKHIQTVMSARVVTAAVDIVEEFSKRALNEVKDKAAAKLADLFEPGPMPRPVDVVDTRLQQMKSALRELPELPKDNVDEDIERFRPKKTFKQKLEENKNGTAIPRFLVGRAPYKEPDSMIKRIIFAFIGG